MVTVLTRAERLDGLLYDAKCSFELCNRPVSLYACRNMVTCRICWARCEVIALLADVKTKTSGKENP